MMEWRKQTHSHVSYYMSIADHGNDKDDDDDDMMVFVCFFSLLSQDYDDKISAQRLKILDSVAVVVIIVVIVWPA